MDTFQDIQKQLLHKSKREGAQKRELLGNRRNLLSVNLDPTYVEGNVDDESDYLEDGDVTGYAFTNGQTEEASPITYHKIHQKLITEGKSGNIRKQAVSKGYDSGYDDYAVPPHPVHNYPVTDTSKPSKEVGLKDITDIALTTLAFLSFGMFILQVLMCITMNKDDSSSMLMLPMEGTDNGDIPGDGNTEEIRRKRRSIFSKETQNIKEIDHIAKRVLFSLSAISSMPEDGGTCHHYSLCENNKFSRRLGDLKKLWIPAWSLGISWLSTRFNKSFRGSQIRNKSPVMNSLKAIVFGLNDGNCSTYTNKCKILFDQH